MAVAAGHGSTYAVGSDGNAYAWGDNAQGDLGDGTQTYSSTPVRVDLPAGVTAKAVAGGSDNGYAIGSDGNVYAWGWNGQGELGDGTTTGPNLCGSSGTDNCSWSPVRVSLPAGVTATALSTAGEPQPGNAYAIGSDGNLYAWGDNTSGQLGDGTTTPSDTPVRVELPAGVHPTAVSGGGYDGYAIGSDGNLYAWGFNGLGGLGNGTTVTSNTPVRVTLPAGVSPVALSGSQDGDGYVIGSDGNLYAWGYNVYGEVGDGTTSGPNQCPTYDPVTGVQTGSEACATLPVRVSLPSEVTALQIDGDGGGGAAALGSDGNVYDWGYVGYGPNNRSDTPVEVRLPSGSTPELMGQGSMGAPLLIANAPDVAPAIITQPTSQSVDAGAPASFNAAASGFPTPTVQWEVSTDGGEHVRPGVRSDV